MTSWPVFESSCAHSPTRGQGPAECQPEWTRRRGSSRPFAVAGAPAFPVMALFLWAALAGPGASATVSETGGVSFATYCFVVAGNWGTGSFYQRANAKGINLFFSEGDEGLGCPNVRAAYPGDSEESEPMPPLPLQWVHYQQSLSQPEC
jgi:hypothetical protein